MGGPTDEVPTAMSTSALEGKLRDLRERSNRHSQALTAKLASTQSGQNLLHIGTSLSSLPPDLHSLLTQLHPVVSAAEGTEKRHLHLLQRLVRGGDEIRAEVRRAAHARGCADLCQDLLAAEGVVGRDASRRRDPAGGGGGAPPAHASAPRGTVGFPSEVDYSSDQLDHVSSLERCAQTTLFLVQDLRASTDVVATLTASRVVSTQDPSGGPSRLPSLRTPLEDDTERAQFLMKLSPRIRRLEGDTILCLTFWMERILRTLQDRRKAQADLTSEEDIRSGYPPESELLLMVGHCMRGLALLGRGREVENIFARVAIMPLIRSKLSMGRLDEGGPRGECSGLASLLEDMVVTVAEAFGPVLQLSEVMFDVGPKVQIDLITDGVWVPVATALMADAGIKMAIFSPGIASILQSNYVALDVFLSQLAARLLRQKAQTKHEPFGRAGEHGGITPAEELYFTPELSPDTIRRAQERIYSHPKTAEFSKRWNLPIYYQLRFGDCCTRLSKAIDQTRREGWTTEVFTGDEAVASNLKTGVGFELSFFLELYDTLLGLWRPDVILRPLTNRFLRGSVQLVGRSVAFIREGMEGKLLFGEVVPLNEASDAAEGNHHQNGVSATNGASVLPLPSRQAYSWGASAPDVASVAWELSILETCLSHDYVTTICDALKSGDSTESERAELESLVFQVLKEASGQIRPLVETAWNELVVKLMIEKCSGPLAAVRGVVATYRMTNRPPPTQASPYVGTILRPLKEFSNDFALRTPDHVGHHWKTLVLADVTERYSLAVEELITTVQRTEVALQNRRARRATSGGISDGDKVKLQLYLDFQAFCRDVQELGVDPSSVKGIAKLRTLTEEAQKLQQNGN